MKQMNIWRGQIYLAMTAVFIGGVALSVFLAMAVDDRWNGAAQFLLYGIAVVCAIGALVTAALSYSQWVPKWERDERRTGKIPGDGGTDEKDKGRF